MKTAEEVEAVLAKEYIAKLKIESDDGTTTEEIPDPFKISEGWIAEEEGVKHWPPTLYPDIYNFLAFHPSELASKDLSDYKTSKGYSYYERGWLKPLNLNLLSNANQFCLLKTTCRPSQKLSDVPHKLWVCLAKRSGKIMAAHCTCMAGVAETCNHVAAALFRIEAAVRMGLSNPSCTSKACEWLPNNKEVKPMKVKDMKLGRGDFGRKGKKTKELMSSPKKRYDPAVKITSPLTLADILAALKPVCDQTDCIAFSAEPKEPNNGVQEEISSEKITTIESVLSSTSNVEEFIRGLEEIPKQLSAIEMATRGQSENPLWFSLRKHVITASKAHDVKTRMFTVLRKGVENTDLTSILGKIDGKAAQNCELPALKYGRSMETEAANTFTQLFSETHSNVKVTECGIFLHEEMPFLGGSPDRIVTCDCCGKACLEIKCPFSIRHTSPQDQAVSLPYLEKGNNNEISLKRNHRYFTQCQIQMASTKTTQCYFFVWTSHGSHLEKVYFDNSLWDQDRKLLKDFYVNIYIPYLFRK